MKIFTTAVLLSFALMSPAVAQDKNEVSFTDGKGDPAGMATLAGTPHGVLMTLDLKGLPAGKMVAFHVHEAGTCDAAAHYESAGGHFNPTDAKHGYMAEGGPHAGDMPNQMVAADGMLKAQVFNSMVTMGEGTNSVMNRALMIHADPDDYKSQPSGAAGTRLACGVIK